MKRLLAFLLFSMFSAATLLAQKPNFIEGVGQGYDGEWTHVSRQLIALAEAIPADKYAWRPAPGVRSTGEVIMHIAGANFYFLSLMGQKLPPDFQSVDEEKVAPEKAKVVDWLKRSLDAAGNARAHVTAADLKKTAKFLDHTVTHDDIYLRMVIHNNEHMGQLVAYARMNGVVPPWSEK
ncbi:hypothetical protein Acid345_2760 [Candidatus Koribacter versatilis Ellin345]|uniref:DinB-like domain-containing protein n=1 Tax=Koribacter versatilis (strain Ellin345) TaxID=204669 RepID=Q1IMY9_KORVE|nr:DinB family protein [Candidatus Koribacter versatilis]ABF41761.1 hypothetical protein Acid345_2760 [Candidatus Koribacter versatilis Ellin345]